VTERKKEREAPVACPWHLWFTQTLNESKNFIRVLRKFLEKCSVQKIKVGKKMTSVPKGRGIWEDQQQGPCPPGDGDVNAKEHSALQVPKRDATGLAV
jgi:hypothetical protein